MDGTIEECRSAKRLAAPPLSQTAPLNAPRLQTEKSFFILNLESVQLCPSAVLPHAISAQNCAEFEVKHKSNSSWTHSNPGTWKLVLILKWKTDWLVANISPTRTQLKSGTVCTVLLGTQFYAFQIQNQKRFLGKAAWGVKALALGLMGQRGGKQIT